MRRYWATVPLLDVDLKELKSYYLANMGEPGSLENDRLTSRCIHKLGGDHYLAHTLIHDWVDAPYEGKLRWGLSTLVGRNAKTELTKIQRRSKLIHQGTSHALIESHQRMEESMLAAQDPKLLKTLSAMATLAQSMVDDDGWHVYRGVNGSQALAILDRLKRTDKIPIALDQTTSFTTSSLVAGNFAFPTHQKIEGRLGIVLGVNVPRHSIFAIPSLYKRLRGEAECIVVSHGSMILDRDDVQVIGAY